MIALIGLSVLCVTGCSSTRSVTADMRSLTSEVVRDTVREQVMVAVHDSVTITKTITITENEQGDTVKVVQVTDRDRVRSRADVRSKKEEVRVVRDTVYVERRDSVLVSALADKATGKSPPAWVQGLKWLFWIVVAVTVLVVVVKFRV